MPEERKTQSRGVISLTFLFYNPIIKITDGVKEEFLWQNCIIPYGTVERVGYTGEEPFGTWMASGLICVAHHELKTVDENGREVNLMEW